MEGEDGPDGLCLEEKMVSSKVSMFLCIQLAELRTGGGVRTYTYAMGNDMGQARHYWSSRVQVNGKYWRHY